MKLDFSRQIFEKNLNIKVRQNSFRGVELFHADGQTDMTKLIVAVGYFANTPNEISKAVCKKRSNDLLIASLVGSALSYVVCSQE